MWFRQQPGKPVILCVLYNLILCYVAIKCPVKSGEASLISLISFISWLVLSQYYADPICMKSGETHEIERSKQLISSYLFYPKSLKYLIDSTNFSLMKRPVQVSRKELWSFVFYLIQDWDSNCLAIQPMKLVMFSGLQYIVGAFLTNPFQE